MFPNTIWNGESATRQDAALFRAPDEADYQAIVGELRAVQEYVLNLANNLKAMPDLPARINEVDSRTADLLAELENVNAVDLQASLAELKADVENHVKEKNDILFRLVNTVRQRLQAVEKLVESFTTETDAKVDAIDQKVSRRLDRLESETRQKLDTYEDRITRLFGILEWGNE
jgi:DNA anti-recombination protein RmuC